MKATKLSDDSKFHQILDSLGQSLVIALRSAGVGTWLLDIRLYASDKGDSEVGFCP